MRIYLETNSNIERVPFNYQQKLVGTVQKWLGYNDIHDSMSLYSFSWLMNGEIETNGFNFSKGSRWFLSFYDETYIKTIIKTILKDPIMFSGMRVVDIKIENTPNLESVDYFKIASPIFIKRKVGENFKHYTYQDSESNELLVQTLKHKMRNANLPEDETLNIEFDLAYNHKKIKTIDYQGVKNKSNLCPIFMRGKPETKAFAWNVGIGNSTGIGFGSLY